MAGKLEATREKLEKKTLDSLALKRPCPPISNALIITLCMSQIFYFSPSTLQSGFNQDCQFFLDVVLFF